jgi:RimJ/RimL family protein N-acetyltransferase
VAFTNAFFETERLSLRRFRPDDAVAFAAYRSDPDVARYQGWDTPYPLTSAMAFVEGLREADPDAEGWFQYAVERRADGVLLGDVGVKRHDERRQAELGFTLAAAHQGQGYASEAVRCLVRHLFEAEGLHRVHAVIDARNDRSAALLERLGFRREGVFRQAGWWKGEWTDDAYYALLATEWSRSSAGA